MNLPNSQNLASIASKNELSDTQTNKMTQQNHKASIFGGLFKKRSFASSLTSLFWDEPASVGKDGTSTSKTVASKTGSQVPIYPHEQARDVVSPFKPNPEPATPKSKIGHLQVNPPSCQSITVDIIEPNVLLQLAYVTRKLVQSLKADYIIRIVGQYEDYIEMNVFDSANDLQVDALFTITLSSIPLAPDSTKNEKVLQVDCCRPIAACIYCSPDHLQVLLTKRNSKSFDSKISSPVPFLIAGPERDSKIISAEAVSLFAWALKTHIKHLPTKARLGRFNIEAVGFLGSGSTATVCEGMFSYGDGTAKQRVACKSVNSNQLYEREVGLLTAVRGCEGLPNMITALPDLKTIVSSPVGMPLHRTKIDDIGSGMTFCSVVNGLRALCERGILHRDVSPGNMVLIKEFNGVSQVCLIDFGMAQRYSVLAKAYSGARSFASDRICRMMVTEGGNKWTEKMINFEFVDDIESLLKTVVWALDKTARRIINESAGAKRLDPAEVLQLWNRVWTESRLGKDALHFLDCKIRLCEEIERGDDAMQLETDRLVVNSPLHGARLASGRRVEGSISQSESNLYELVHTWLLHINLY